MHAAALPALTADEIDDLLYFTRTNSAADLHQTLTEFSHKYQCRPQHVLEACVDPETGNSVLHFCSANGFVDLTPELLSQLKTADPAISNATATPALVNHANKEGNTPLHWAAYNGHVAIVKMLVAAGADMWIKNAAGHLAMFEAERADKSEVVQYLLEAGGREVESTGVERPATAEDVDDTQPGESSSTAAGAQDAVDGINGANSAG